MKNDTVKNIVISVLALTTVFFCYNDHKSSKELRHIKEITDKNPKLRDCFVHPRKIIFMQRGATYLPDYDNPQTLNEKVAYYLDKYFLHSPIRKVIGTKYFAKKYIADIVGQEHVVPLLGVWDNPENIEWEKLPNKFVLKTVRGNCGREVIIVTDKSKLDIPSTISALKRFCRVPGMLGIRKKRIIAEEFLEVNGKPVMDYKFFCSYGRPIIAYCLEMNHDADTEINTKTMSFYTVPGWKVLPFKAGIHEENNVPPPKNLKKMLELCAKLSAPFPLIRIDLYERDDQVFVGELTEDASGAKNVIKPSFGDFILGDSIPVISREEIDKMITKDREIAKKYLESSDDIQ